MRNTGSRIKSGMTIICGIDEAGRGALAGPLVSAAVILPFTKQALERKAGVRVRDGKLLTPKKRGIIYAAAKKLGAVTEVAIISVRQINTRGIGWANTESMRMLIKSLDAHEYICDGKLKLRRINGKSGTVRSVVDADATIYEVIVAGIVAKVERDRLMRKLHKEHPLFRWWTNKGYGTLDHIEALRIHGATKHHRTLFVSTALKQKI